MRHKRWFKTTVGMVLISITHLAGESAAQEEGDCPLGTKLLASDGVEGAGFGQAVAVFGDTVVVGARHDPGEGFLRGAAYVYRLDSLSWIEEQKLLASEVVEHMDFGSAVAIDGDLVLVGATNDFGNAEHSGSAYVFRHDGSSWAPEQKLFAAAGASSDGFGTSVAFSGKTVLIGSPFSDDAGSSSGSVCVFNFDGSSWIQDQTLVADDAGAGDNFGSWVRLMGDTAVVGAYLDNDNGADSGSAYVFRYHGNTWTQEQKLVPDDGESADWFGISVAIWGDTILVGAPLDDEAGPDAGAAYVFRYADSTWIPDGKIVLVDGVGNNWFGTSVGLFEQTGVFGGALEEAYVFRDNRQSWIETGRVVAGDSDIHPNADFGFSVAIDGDTLVVGAGDDDDNGEYSGSAYVLVGVAADCNGNGGADGCDIATGISVDCNSNSVPDECDIDSGSSLDCNDNAVPDSCDMADDTSADCNGNLVPDECEDRCSADANRDCVIDPLDVGFVQARFGCVYPYDGVNCLRADVNNDGIVDPLDVGYVLSRFGPCE